MKSKENNMNSKIKKAFVFDFDDTLATTNCSVIVRDENANEILKLTPAEFNSYKLDENEHFDFSEFYLLIDPKETELFTLAREVYNEGHACFILTARGSIAGKAIASFLIDHGIVAKEIHCVGDEAGSIEENKRKVLLAIIEGYDKIYFYDDHAGNIESAPDSNKLKTYLV